MHNEKNYIFGPKTVKINLDYATRKLKIGVYN